MKPDFTPSDYFDADEEVFKYGANMRQARKSAQLTQIDAAQKIGIAVNSLRLYEADKRIPSAKVLAQMADAYGVTMQYLFTGQEFDLQDLPKTRLLNAFGKLNPTGKRKAVERIEELVEIAKYVLPAFQSDPQSTPSTSDDTGAASPPGTSQWPPEDE